MRIVPAFILGAAALSVSACAAADGAYGSGVAYGYGAPNDFNCYNNGLYGDAYSIGNCGWYDGYFYPGFGSFMFDRNHNRHQMNGGQRDRITRQARGPGGAPRVGLGSSGGVVPPGVSQPQQMPGNGSGFRGGGGHR